jgi:hypothetical protein
LTKTNQDPVDVSLNVNKGSVLTVKEFNKPAMEREISIDRMFN